MTLTTISSRELNQDVTRAKKAAKNGLLAATALVHGMAMVTRNVVDFESTGVDVVNPWAPLA